MKVNGQDLFNIDDVNSYIEKFRDKIQEMDSKIKQLESDIEKLDEEIDSAMEKDILEATASSRKELQNVQARKVNVHSQLNTELEKAAKVKEIMSKGLSDLVPNASRRLQKDLQIYNDVVEREVYCRLQEVRREQEELLLSLQLVHNTVSSELHEFNEICNVFRLEKYRHSVSNQSFHNNLFIPNRSFPEFGSPLINCSSLPTIEDVLNRSRADANAMFNSYKSVEEKEQLPRAKSLKDIDLQKFLDRIGKSYEVKSKGVKSREVKGGKADEDKNNNQA